MEQEALGKSREFENTHSMPKNMRESMNEENEKLTHVTAEPPAPATAPTEGESETTLPVEKSGSETTPAAPIPQASQESIVLRGLL